MLVNKKYDSDTIVSFKLVNGDEIVAKVINETDTGYEISKPCTIVPGQQGIGLMQSLFTGDLSLSTTVISKTHVMFHAKTVKEIENHYIKTTTGIEPVSAGSIVV
jgi:hypothetical protein